MTERTIDEKIVPVILPQDLDLSTLILDSPAEEEESELGEERDTNGDEGRIVEFRRLLLAVVSDDGSDGFYDEDHVHGSHEEGVDDLVHGSEESVEERGFGQL